MRMKALKHKRPIILDVSATPSSFDDWIEPESAPSSPSLTSTSDSFTSSTSDSCPPLPHAETQEKQPHLWQLATRLLGSVLRVSAPSRSYKVHDEATLAERQSSSKSSGGEGGYAPYHPAPEGHAPTKRERRPSKDASAAASTRLLRTNSGAPAFDCDPPFADATVPLPPPLPPPPCAVISARFATRVRAKSLSKVKSKVKSKGKAS